MSSWFSWEVNPRDDPLSPAYVPWYKRSGEGGSDSLPMGSFRVVTLQSGIAKRRMNAAKKKRPKDYSSDSSASAKSTDGHTEGRIYKSPSGASSQYFVYHKGKKITFGDPSMPNRQDNDGARKNFRARHGCNEKKDKSKAGYWAYAHATQILLIMCSV